MKKENRTKTKDSEFFDDEIKSISFDESGKKIIYLKENVRRVKEWPALNPTSEDIEFTEQDIALHDRVKKHRKMIKEDEDYN